MAATIVADGGRRPDIGPTSGREGIARTTAMLKRPRLAKNSGTPSRRLVQRHADEAGAHQHQRRRQRERKHHVRRKATATTVGMLRQPRQPGDDQDEEEREERQRQRRRVGSTPLAPSGRERQLDEEDTRRATSRYRPRAPQRRGSPGSPSIRRPAPSARRDRAACRRARGPARPGRREASVSACSTQPRSTRTERASTTSELEARSGIGAGRRRRA